MTEFSAEDWPYQEHGMAAKVEQARKWILEENGKLKLGLFEVEIKKYPGDERAFIFAWVDLRGGI